MSILDSTMNDYWNERYLNGGTSGGGSINDLARWKWKIIELYTDYQDVVDYGCGDLSFWLGRDSKRYKGIDISDVILERNKITHPNWSFIQSQDQENISKLHSTDVFCLDVLFHIMEDQEYDRILKNVFLIATEHIFIYTWRVNPFDRVNSLKQIFRNKHILDSIFQLRHIIFPVTTDNKYQKYRQLYTIDFHVGKHYKIKSYPAPDGIGVMLVYSKQQ